MDFLDPIKKRQRSIRLNIGHFLMVAIVLMGTYILVLRAQGYEFDRKSGEVIQNALVFVDSAPDGATIKVNGQLHKELTNTRLALPEGNYKLELNKQGYRGWQREFAVVGGIVERFTYPVLFPEKMVSSELQTFDAVPTIATASPDRRWLLMGQPGAMGSFIQYDLNSLTNNKPSSTNFKLPDGILSTPDGPQGWEIIEWSSDNKHVLLKHIIAGGQEFIVIDRDNPSQSVNVNRQLGQNLTSVVLRDKKFDKVYIYSSTDQTLKTADLKTKVVTPLLNGVLSFKSHGDDMLLYAMAVPNDPAKNRIFLRSGSNTYVLRDIPASSNIPLDIARFDGHWYAAVGSDGEQKAYVYKDPENVLKLRDGTRPPIVSVLRSGGAIQTLSFSQNTRMIVAQSGQHFHVYDAEAKKSYQYDLIDPIDPNTKPAWMDGHRLMIRSAGKIVVFDYDGINKQTLVAAEPSIPSIFDRDYEALYGVAPSATGGKLGLIRTELRTESD